MTKVKNQIRWLLPAAVLLILALVFASVPVYAAEGDDTTDETEASVSFTAGELKLESVPMLNFGSHDISHEEQVLEAVNVSPNVQVSDLRGNGNGWDLVVSLTPFQLNGGGQTLQAASIQFDSPVVSAVNGNVGTPPSAVSRITLTSDSTETPVMSAESGEGMGVWSLGWDNEDVKLTVKPGTAQEGTSVATLNWSLQTTP